MDYFQFRKSFESSLGKLKLPDDCTLREPAWEIITPPHFWTVELYLDFPDPKHIRIWESYDKIAGLQLSRKVQWSYHFGDTALLDEGGGAVKGKPDDPLDLRIDTVGGLHMHCGQREPHYAQKDIKGLDLATLSALDFVRAVFKHREKGKPLHEILGFRIKGL